MQAVRAFEGFRKAFGLTIPAAALLTDALFVTATGELPEIGGRDE